MSILFDNNAYFVAVWYLSPDRTKALEDQMDGLAALWRPLDHGSPWHLQNRTRRYNDPEAFDSRDSKTWTDATLPGTVSEAEAFAKSSVMASILQRATGTRLQEIPLRCDGHTAMERLLAMKLDWLHATQAPEAQP